MHYLSYFPRVHYYVVKITLYTMYNFVPIFSRENKKIYGTESGLNKVSVVCLTITLFRITNSYT